MSLQLAGCASSDSQPASLADTPPGLDNVRVCSLVKKDDGVTWMGSGVPIGNSVVATCMHVFPFTPLRPQQILIDGRETEATIYSSGGEDWRVIPDDWMKFRISPGIAEPSPSTRIDFSHPVTVGETIYLIGFTRRASPPDDPDTPLRTVVVSRVTRINPDGTFQTDAQANTRYRGMSGGAAAIYDDKTQQWVIVGLCRDSTVKLLNIGVATWVTDRYVTVVRPRSVPRP